MSDPKLTRSSVEIRYTADDGYSTVSGYRTGKGAPVAGDATKPEGAILAGLEELARIAALFGYEAEARKTVDEAFSRVAEWRAQRTESAA